MFEDETPDRELDPQETFWSKQYEQDEHEFHDYQQYEEVTESTQP